MNRISLKQYGIDFEGEIEDAMHIETHLIPEFRPYFERASRLSLWTADNRRFLERIGPFEEGGNGNVDEWA